jgi:hypothetical protein
MSIVAMNIQKPCQLKKHKKNSHLKPKILGGKVLTPLQKSALTVKALINLAEIQCHRAVCLLQPSGALITPLLSLMSSRYYGGAPIRGGALLRAMRGLEIISFCCISGSLVFVAQRRVLSQASKKVGIGFANTFVKTVTTSKKR